MIQTFPQIIDLVSAGCPDGRLRGPVVVSVLIWDGRRITGNYYKGSQEPDYDTHEGIIFDDLNIRPLVETLVKNGKPFVVRQGSSDDTCTLIWEIQ